MNDIYSSTELFIHCFNKKKIDVLNITLVIGEGLIWLTSVWIQCHLNWESFYIPSDSIYIRYRFRPVWRNEIKPRICVTENLSCLNVKLSLVVSRLLINSNSLEISCNWEHFSRWPNYIHPCQFLFLNPRTTHFVI